MLENAENATTLLKMLIRVKMLACSTHTYKLPRNAYILTVSVSKSSKANISSENDNIFTQNANILSENAKFQHAFLVTNQPKIYLHFH